MLKSMYFSEQLFIIYSRDGQLKVTRKPIFRTLKSSESKSVESKNK